MAGKELTKFPVSALQFAKSVLSSNPPQETNIRFMENSSLVIMMGYEKSSKGRL